MRKNKSQIGTQKYKNMDNRKIVVCDDGTGVILWRSLFFLIILYFILFPLFLVHPLTSLSPVVNRPTYIWSTEKRQYCGTGGITSCALNQRRWIWTMMGSLRSVCCADGRSRVVYPMFNDVHVFDVTQKTNKLKMPFVLFTGVNHHCQSILLCGVLLEIETVVHLFGCSNNFTIASLIEHLLLSLQTKMQQWQGHYTGIPGPIPFL